MQNDFIDGSLGTKEAQEIVTPVAEKIRNFEGDIYGTLDTHEEDYLSTQEGKNLPVKHCICGEDGWALNSEIMQAIAETKAEVHNFCRKGTFGSMELAQITVEDLSLLNALRQGDGNSFDHLFRRYYPMLCAYAHRLVSLEDAEEIVQEVMLWLWENRGDLIIESSLNQYLFKMTYRRVLNHLTREQVKTKAEAAFYERTQAALCEVDYGRFEELDRKIKEAMAALPDSYREAFVMHRFKELSYKEIAEVLDVSPQTVAYRIQQALKLLRVSLKDYLPMLVWLVG